MTTLPQPQRKSTGRRESLAQLADWPPWPAPRTDLGALTAKLARTSRFEVRGRVSEITGLLVRARIPGARVGEICHLLPRGREQPVPAQVVGFRDRQTFLMGLGSLEGVGPDTEVRSLGESRRVPVGEGLLGRVLDGLGQPMDGDGPLRDLEPTTYPVLASPPDPMLRRRIDRQITTGIRAIDGCLTLGEGQRVGIFAAAGQGKSTLLGMLARGTDADVNVIALIGERGREVREFLEEALGEQGRKRSVVVVATSDQPSLVRLEAAYVATAIAESFRDAGKRVLFLMDSVTRFARAQREIGLAIGEPPARAGFPPSVFALLPTLLERTGTSEHGSITAVYTVLVEGDDHNEPVADEVRSILDGHIMLSSELAARGHFPAIDLLSSKSRLFRQLAEPEHAELARDLGDLVEAYESHRDLILIDAYKTGTDPRVDRAIEKKAAIEQFVRQDVDERSPWPSTYEALEAALAESG